MLEPLLMSKAVFDKLPKDQQGLIMTIGAEMEKFALEGARGGGEARRTEISLFGKRRNRAQSSAGGR